MSDRNWSCKSLAFVSVATAFLQGQEGAEELVRNGEVQAVSSCKVANSERKENKALQEGRKEKAGCEEEGKGQSSEESAGGKREMEPESLQLPAGHSGLGAARPVPGARPRLAWHCPPCLASPPSLCSWPAARPVEPPSTAGSAAAAVMSGAAEQSSFTSCLQTCFPPPSPSGWRH